MKKRFGPSLYFASDKAIFDALNHSQAKTDVLRDLLFERGIIVSAKTEKQDLAKYFSRLTADYYDHKDIGSRLGRIARKERVTYAEIHETVTQAQVISAVQEIKAELESEGGVAATLSLSNGRIIAELVYDDIDYSEGEFRQVQNKDAFIEFTPDVDGYIIRSTQNKFVDAVVDRVFKSLEKVAGMPVFKSRIGLEGFADPSKRTQFFETLTKTIGDHPLVTVTEAFCFKPKAGQQDPDGEDDAKELEDQPYVERVALRGTGVDRSFVVDGLYTRGYYVVKAAWRVKPISSMDSDVFELEAQFTSPDKCTDFSYQVRHAFVFEDGKITDRKRAAKSSEKDILFRLIEKSAKAAIAKLKE